ncbi:hypothetical protein AB3N60_18860 [Leptospira sp. WS39.C2]
MDQKHKKLRYKTTDDFFIETKTWKQEMKESQNISQVSLVEKDETIEEILMELWVSNVLFRRT